MRTPTLLALLLVACRKDPPPEPIVVAPPVVAPTPAFSEPVEVPLPPPAPDVLERVYFDFDSYALDGPDLILMTDNAWILDRHLGVRIQIEGHCDERGTTEYNLALGEHRAVAAKEALVSLGVDPARIETISYGEEVPAFAGHDESAWSRNRRIEIRVVFRTPSDGNVYGTEDRVPQPISRR